MYRFNEISQILNTKEHIYTTNITIILNMIVWLFTETQDCFAHIVNELYKSCQCNVKRLFTQVVIIINIMTETFTRIIGPVHMYKNKYLRTLL